MVIAKKINFLPKKTTKRLLNPLNARAKEVIVGRFGLGEAGEKKTLESIGKKYGITRERVRQIENFALKVIKKSEEFIEEQPVFEEVKKMIKDFGGLVHEEDFLKDIAKDKITQNHINFYLVLDDEIKEHKEDDEFNKRWSVDEAVAESVHNALTKLHGSITEEEMLAQDILLAQFLSQIDGLHDAYKSKEVLQKYLELSKVLGANQLGEWGRKTSPNIKTRGIKDFAYLVIRKAGRPMHFREVSKEILAQFKRKAHTATTHNELIRDPRFVLVGRGIYAIREWGHAGGVVRDVIKNILKAEGKAMNKEDIIEKVKKERIVKENTVIVNLQNPNHFVKLADGKYNIK
jgi:Sigma-70, region 4/HB1, ASXL, restriction endonuclease HTH domain